MKGETSGNFLEVQQISRDCDQDAILVKVKPFGNTCHTGEYSCFGEEPKKLSFLFELETLIQIRNSEMPKDSYTTYLFREGINKIAQKVGEEAVELIIESKDSNGDLFLNEAADLFYHALVLIAAKGYKLEDVIEVLRERHER
jgi:phosphoribosyl-ATP pyrophosphohydrolase/phosphoribosyl-AMP cyclohydrolase